MKIPGKLFMLFLAGFFTLSSCIKEDINERANGDNPTALKSGVVLTVPDSYPTIQSAINQASNGDIVHVNPGIYAEQVEVRDLDNIRIEGDNATITIPAAGMTGSLVKIYNCQGIHFTGFTIDGLEGASVIPGAINGDGDQDTRFYGLFAINSSGHITSNSILNISWHNGDQQGVGIYTLIDDGIERNMQIKFNEVLNFQVCGITSRGPAQIKIQGNTIEHWNEPGIISLNGIQVDGGKIMITGNNVSYCKSFDIFNPFLQPGNAMYVIAGQYPVDELKVVNNIISDSDFGLVVLDYGPGISKVKVIHNSFNIILFSPTVLPPDSKEHANVYL